MSSRDDYPYPEDEFDALGADRAPQGVHRAPLPRWRQLLPFLIVLVLAPTLAFVAVRAFSGGDGEPGGQQPTTTQAPTDAGSSDEATDSTSEETTTEEPSSEEPSTEETGADLDQSITIWVLNGSGVTGLAADTVAVLEAAGWEGADADDYASSLPTSTTIFYDNADQAEEAQAVGEELGIDTLVESSDAADGDIVIVLRSDFSLP